MIIVSQNRKTIVNFNNICNIDVNSWGTGEKFTIDCNDVSNFEILLGEYETEERAKEVLEALYNWFSVVDKFGSRTIRYDEAIAQALTGQLRVFEMPKR